jgi:hypothetical protein
MRQDGTENGSEYMWFADPNHAWLRVDKKEYLLTGFNASQYSYQDEQFVYLEEDFDATLYLSSNQPNPGNIPETFYQGLCPVRQLARIGA